MLTSLDHRRQRLFRRNAHHTPAIESSLVFSSFLYEKREIVLRNKSVLLSSSVVQHWIIVVIFVGKLHNGWVWK